MRNWLGQDIVVGSVVGRGARQGDGSDFKIGVVTKLYPDKQKARVEWKFASTAVSLFVEKGRYPNGRPYGDWKFLAFTPYAVDSAGNPTIESLVLLSEEDLERAKALDELREAYKELDDMSEEEFLDRYERLC